MKKYSGYQGVINAYMDLFDYLPIAALVDNKIFCINGGICPELKSLDQLSMIDRFQEIEQYSLFAELLWCEPFDNENVLFWPKAMRGSGSQFGPGFAERFM